MLAKNAGSSLAGPGCWLIRQPRQPINLETEFAKASQGPADEFIVRAMDKFKSARIKRHWSTQINPYLNSVGIRKLKKREHEK